VTGHRLQTRLAWRVGNGDLGAPMIAGVIAGVTVACLGWSAALVLWPIGLIPAILPRMRVVALGVIVAVLTVSAIAQVKSAATALAVTGELQYGEAIIYGQAARLLRGEPLYQPLDRPPYTVTAYTPAYYWLGAALRLAFGEGFGPGRGLSLLAGLAAAALIGWIVARQAGRRWPGLLAGLLFLALGMPWVASRADLFFAGDVIQTAWMNLVADLPLDTPWMGFYKEDVLGVAFSLAAVAALQAGTRPGPVAAAGVLAALAILTKQTLVAPAVAGAIWLVTCRRRRDATRFAAVVTVLVVGSVVALEVSSGAFIANAVLGNVNPMQLDVLAATTPMLVRFQAGPIVIAALTALPMLRTPKEADRLLVLYWLASMLPLVGLAKAGANHNHWIEFAASTAILATLGLWRAFRPGKRARLRSLLPVLLLAATLMAATPLVGGAERMRPSWPQPDPGEVKQTHTLVDRVRSEPGAVLSAALDLVALADRPILLEPYIFSMLEREGRWDSDALVQRICGGEIGLLIFEHPLEDGSGRYHGYDFWPARVLAALQDTMALDREEGGYLLYVPRPIGAARPPGAQPRVCPE
jgi:hypothetical protein